MTRPGFVSQHTRKPGKLAPLLIGVLGERERMERTTPTRTPATLPDLDPGLTMLTLDSDVEHALHALTVDHVLQSGGDALWVDSGRYAQTGPLVEMVPTDCVSPARRILERVHVARAFTPFQHLALLQSLSELRTDRTELVVVPDFDGYYRGGELLADEGQEMLLTGLASVAALARRHDVPVLVTRRREDEFSEPLATAATRTVVCEATPFGPRFRTDETDTLVYPTEHRGWVQTTFAFWKRALATRQSLYDEVPGTGESTSTREVTVRGTN